MEPWEVQSHQAPDISGKISKPSNHDTTTGLDDWYDLSSYIRNPSDVDMWQSTSPSYEGSSELPNISKLSDLDDTITNFNKQKFIWISRAIPPFYASIPTLSSVWWNTSPISQAEEPRHSYIAKTNLQKIVHIIREYRTNSILQQINSTGWSSLDIYQETERDSQKRKVLERLTVIAQREDNWDGYDSKKPTELTIKRAEHFIKGLLDNEVISARLLQLEPFICSDEDGYITIECYKGKRSLCFDIQEDETNYTKIEKTSANTMTQTDSLNQDNYLPLLEWFLDE